MSNPVLRTLWSFVGMSCMFAENGRMLNESASVVRKGFRLVGLVAFLSVLPTQPVGGQQSDTAQPAVIESRAHYSFSVPNNSAGRTGSSQSVVIEKIEPEVDLSDRAADEIDVDASRSANQLVYPCYAGRHQFCAAGTIH